MGDVIAVVDADEEWKMSQARRSAVWVGLEKVCGREDDWILSRCIEVQ